MHEPPEKISQQQSRCITNKEGFLMYPLLLIIYLLIYLFCKLGAFIDHLSAKETWENKTYSNSPSEAISNAVLLMNATLRAMQDENLYENPYIAIIIGLLRALCFVGIMYFILMRVTLTKLMRIFCKIFNMEYMHHFTVINGSRSIISMLSLVILYSQWNNLPKKFNFFVILWGSTEFFNLYINFLWYTTLRCVKFRTPTFRDILRFYFLRRNLILFQLLNLTIMLSIVAGVTVLVKIYCESSMLTYQFAFVGSFSFVAIIHTCAKMAIMLASASYNWDEDEEGVSWKLIATSLWTIIRYHLGSIVFYFPTLEWTSYTNGGNRNSDCLKGEFYVPNDPILTMECSEMLIAIHGQYFAESKNTLCHSKIKNWINKHFKSITSTIWTDIMVYSSSVFAMLIITGLTNPQSTVEDLLSTAVYVSAYIIINGLYYYITIQPVNVIEMTIEFSKIVTQEELKIMELELSTETNESKDVVTEI